MAQNFKFFVSGVSAENDIVNLRKIFPNSYFIDGNYKGAKGAFVVRELNNKEYGEKHKSVLTKEVRERGFFKPDVEITFWEPSCSTEEFNIEAYRIKREPIPACSVTLKNGKVLKINPAAGEPQQLLFGEVEEEKLEFASLYSRSTEYGRLAYTLIYLESELKEKGGLLVTDKRVQKLVELALRNSYELPSDIWNWLGWISMHDISSLFQAAMGAHESFLLWLGGSTSE